MAQGKCEQAAILFRLRQDSLRIITERLFAVMGILPYIGRVFCFGSLFSLDDYDVSPLCYLFVFCDVLFLNEEAVKKLLPAPLFPHLLREVLLAS